MKNKFLSMKRVVALLLIAALLPLSSSCSIQLYERLLIHAIGVDRLEDGYRVTV